MKYILLICTFVFSCSMWVHAQWSTSPTMNNVISSVANNQIYPTMLSDGAGGAFITWQDFRSGTNYDIYVQRINAAGVVLWAADGVPISTTAHDQTSPTIVGDSAGGAIITWTDGRSGTNNDIYAQRINAAGVAQWAPDGVPISTAAHDQTFPTITTDRVGGAIITWQDFRGGTNWDVYAQRVNALGAVQWTPDGVPISAAGDKQISSLITSDGAGGAIITWLDFRSGTNYDIYAQRINIAGTVQWTADGLPISTAANNQFLYRMTSDGAGGAIIAWQDYRSSATSDIYAQHVDHKGYLGTIAPALSAVRDVSPDQGGKLSVAWQRMNYDADGNQLITYYSVWRGMDPGAAFSQSKVTSPGGMTMNFTARAYRVITSAAGTTNWEWIANVPAHYLSSYDFTAPTLSDSDASGRHYAKFFVSAQTANPFVFWDSNVDSGYSADNLAPSPVRSITAQIQPGPSMNVHWGADMSDPDVSYYELHRSSRNGFVSDASNKIGQTSDTMLVDASPDTGSLYYYSVVTVDIHGNKSVPSPQASAGIAKTVQYSLADKWNLVSVPLTVDDYHNAVLYPKGISKAFAYEGTYVVKSTLANAIGYWVMFSGSQTVSMTGFLRTMDTIDVAVGWNLIGSISSPIAVSSITSLPGGIVTSHFYGYNSGYTNAATIEPGKGYWVNVNQGGKLILGSSSGAASESNRIRIGPSAETPPPPPNGRTQARLPLDFALEQNYPNPFNPTTSIHYQLPVESRVAIMVSNTLGQLVATLVDRIQGAGYRSVEWRADHLPSGMYLYRIQAVSTMDGGKSFTKVRKLLLLK